MTIADLSVDEHRSEAVPDLSAAAILTALKARIAQYRGDPKRYRLTQHAVDVDPAMQPIFQAAKRLDPGEGRDWWRRWLIRAGMSVKDAELAVRGRTYTRESVVLELQVLYKQAVRERTWPEREIVMDHALRARARRTFGSPQAAREAAILKLGLRRPKPARVLRDAEPGEEILVRSLSERLTKILPLDRGKGAGERVSLSSVAAELGLRRWRKPGYLAQSVEQLLFRALDPDPDVLSRLVRTAIKRAVRYRHRREGWAWSRWDPGSLKQPIWREEVEEIVQILRGAGAFAGDLGEESFLRSLPRRTAAWSGDFYSTLKPGAESPRVKGAGGSGRRAPTPCATPVAAPPAPKNPGRTMSGT